MSSCHGRPRLRRTLASLIIAGAVALCLLLAFESRSPLAPAPQAPASSSQQGVRDNSALAGVLRLADHAASKPDFFVSEVRVDKPEVCRGERAVVSIRAEYPAGDPDLLVPAIGGRVGWAVSVIAPGESAGTYDIPIQLGEPRLSSPGELVEREQTSARIKLKDCDAPSALWVTSQQPTHVEEDARLKATWIGLDSGKARAANQYVWDFGDGSARVHTAQPEVRHVFPAEEDRGPGKRVFTYLVNAEAFDDMGRSMARGALALTFRNHLEELKYTDHRLQLLARYHPHASVTKDGTPFIDVSLTNLDVRETAELTALEFRIVPCSASAARFERHAPAEVFESRELLPRATISGRLMATGSVSPADCHLDVSVIGNSYPGQLVVGGQFSMRLRLDDDGVESISDPSRRADVEQAMALLGKPYVTGQDLADLVELGRLPASVLASARR